MKAYEVIAGIQDWFEKYPIETTDQELKDDEVRGLCQLLLDRQGIFSASYECALCGS